MTKILETLSQDQKQFSFNTKKNLILCFVHVSNLVSKETIDSGIAKRLPGEDV
jgi:hypothetical protein